MTVFFSFSPHKNENFRSGLMFYCRCIINFLFRKGTSELRRREILHGLCRPTRLKFKNSVQKFEGPPPKNFRGQKTCKIWCDFGRLPSSTTKSMNIFKIGQVLDLP